MSRRRGKSSFAVDIIFFILWLCFFWSPAPLTSEGSGRHQHRADGRQETRDGSSAAVQIHTSHHRLTGVRPKWGAIRINWVGRESGLLDWPRLRKREMARSGSPPLRRMGLLLRSSSCLSSFLESTLRISAWLFVWQWMCTVRRLHVTVDDGNKGILRFQIRQFCSTCNPIHTALTPRAWFPRRDIRLSDLLHGACAEIDKLFACAALSDESF